MRLNDDAVQNILWVPLRHTCSKALLQHLLDSYSLEKVAKSCHVTTQVDIYCIVRHLPYDRCNKIPLKLNVWRCCRCIVEPGVRNALSHKKNNLQLYRTRGVLGTGNLSHS